MAWIAGLVRAWLLLNGLSALIVGVHDLLVTSGQERLRASVFMVVGFGACLGGLTWHLRRTGADEREVWKRWRSDRSIPWFLALAGTTGSALLAFYLSKTGTPPSTTWQPPWRIVTVISGVLALGVGTSGLDFASSANGNAQTKPLDRRSRRRGAMTVVAEALISVAPLGVLVGLSPQAPPPPALNLKISLQRTTSPKPGLMAFRLVTERHNFTSGRVGVPAEICGVVGTRLRASSPDDVNFARRAGGLNPTSERTLSRDARQIYSEGIFTSRGLAATYLEPGETMRRTDVVLVNPDAYDLLTARCSVWASTGRKLLDGIDPAKAHRRIWAGGPLGRLISRTDSLRPRWLYRVEAPIDDPSWIGRLVRGPRMLSVDFLDGVDGQSLAEAFGEVGVRVFPRQSTHGDGDLAASDSLTRGVGLAPTSATAEVTLPGARRRSEASATARLRHGIREATGALWPKYPDSEDFDVRSSPGPGALPAASGSVAQWQYALVLAKDGPIALLRTTTEASWQLMGAGCIGIPPALLQVWGFGSDAPPCLKQVPPDATHPLLPAVDAVHAVQEASKQSVDVEPRDNPRPWRLESALAAADALYAFADGDRALAADEFIEDGFTTGVAFASADNSSQVIGLSFSSSEAATAAANFLATQIDDQVISPVEVLDPGRSQIVARKVKIYDDPLYAWYATLTVKGCLFVVEHVGGDSKSLGPKETIVQPLEAIVRILEEIRPETVPDCPVAPPVGGIAGQPTP